MIDDDCCGKNTAPSGDCEVCGVSWRPSGWPENIKGAEYSQRTIDMITQAGLANTTLHFEARADLPLGTIRIEGQNVIWSMDVRNEIIAYERSK